MSENQSPSPGTDLPWLTPSLARRLLFLLVVTVVFGLVLVYPVWRLTTLLWPDVTLSPAVIGLLFALPFGLRALHERVHRPWSRWLSAVVMTWVGISFIALCLLLLAEPIVLLAPSAQREVGLGVLTLLIGLTVYSLVNAQRLSTRVIDLHNTGAAQGTRLVQISDVHIGSRQPGFLRPIVERVNELEGDYVLITGDLIDMRDIDVTELAELGRIKAPALFCIGNHERYVDLKAICERLRQLGIQVLRNQSVEHGAFQFIGIDDAERRDQVARELQQLEPLPDRYRVLLYHRPDGDTDAEAWGVNLMLTGHTHRGQIVPFNFLVKKVFPKYYLSYPCGNMLLYVSPGTGTWGPVMRLGSKCEVTMFKLL